MQCAICQENIQSSCHTLECGHKYHVDCIISWFRSGKKACPICRNEGCSIENVNFAYIKNMITMQSCPPHLKDAYAEYKKISRKLSKLEYRLKGYKKEHRRNCIFHIKRIKRKKQRAKKYLCAAHVFIVPVKKIIFTED